MGLEDEARARRQVTIALGAWANEHRNKIREFSFPTLYILSASFHCICIFKH